MDFQDFLKKKQYGSQKLPMHSYINNYSKFSRSKFDPIMFIKRIQNNKKLKIVFLVFLIFVIIVIVGIILIFYSLISSIYSYSSSTGIAGIVDDVLKYLTDLWNGTK